MTQSPFSLRGLAEAFYGTFYTFPERQEMIRFAGLHGFNFYLYGPKNDRQHRQRWWTPYPERVLAEFGATIAVAQEHNVEFCYAISFGVPVNASSQADFDTITAKLRRFYDLGCRSFAILLDDLALTYGEADVDHPFDSVGQAHAYFTNRVHEWLALFPDQCALYLCPTEYWGPGPFTSYLHDLGSNLRPGIGLFYTGPAICSPTISVENVKAFAEATGRLPIIWDNYPVNDLVMRPGLHLGPLIGRDPHLFEGCRGYMANMMLQAEASKIPLRTTAEYVADPVAYDPEGAWYRAFHEVGGESYDALHLLAENSVGSPLQPEEAPVLTRLATDTLADLLCGTSVTASKAATDLQRYLDELDEAIYDLKNRMENLVLRQSLMPWIEALDDKLWLGKIALKILRGLELGLPTDSAITLMEERITEVEGSSKRIGGSSLQILAGYVRDRLLTSGVSSSGDESGLLLESQAAAGGA